MKRLLDQCILVTGSTAGIGKAIAKACLDEGARVLIHGLEPDLAEETWAELDPDRSRSDALVADLGQPDAPALLREAMLRRFGRIDGLVNNAALVGTGRIEDCDGERFDQFLAVNVRAPYLLIRELLPDLEKTRGSVVNIGSVNAYCGEPDLLPYSVSKGALMTLTRNLGDTLHRERGVRINQVNPGWVLTENERVRKQEQGLPEDWPRLLGPQFAPSGRLFSPEEIAAPVVYFLGKESGPVSGSVLDVEQHPFIGRNPAKDLDGLGG